MWRVFRSLPVPAVFSGAAFGLVLSAAALTRPPSSPPPAPSRSTVLELPGEAEREEVILRNLTLKQRVAWQVIDGSRGLLEAAAEIRRINRTSPHFRWDVFRQTVLGGSDDERHCRVLVDLVGQELMLNGRSEEAVEWTERLKDEIECLRQSGTLHLPADTPP